jgi:thymidine phosphorylase
MTSTLKHSRTEALEASISAAERKIAESNERIILDLMRGRDTIAAEERVARELATLTHMRRRHGRPAGRPVR